ncbi:MAG TPA: HlyD family secretion protein [Polyangiaceae bacterium]|nr:HlyD family secretion protein [Polyangiaceae bacterium]
MTVAVSENPKPVVDATPQAPAEPKKRNPFAILLTIFGAAAVIVAGYLWHIRNQETTDDAMIEADVVAVTPRVNGMVAQVLVEDNQPVRAGQVLVELDSRELQARLNAAQADLATAQAQARAALAQESISTATAEGGLKSAQAQVSGSALTVASADADIEYKQAGLVRAQAEAERSQLNLQRTQEMQAKNAIAQQELDDAKVANTATQAALNQAKAALAAALEQRRVAQSRVADARGKLAQSAPVDAQAAAAKAATELAQAHVESAQAAVELARLQLSYASIAAPADGVVTELVARPGQILAAGQAIAQVVPNDPYVVANFKETQIGRMHAGQHAEIAIDAYPGQTFDGTVESLAAGTGSRFSLLPADNASGNFVKVVQRVPVTVRLSQPPAGLALKAGLSASVTVLVR